MPYLDPNFALVVCKQMYLAHASIQISAAISFPNNNFFNETTYLLRDFFANQKGKSVENISSTICSAIFAAAAVVYVFNPCGRFM